MKLKTLIVTVVVLALVSAGAYFATRTTPPPSTDSRINQPLVAASLVEKTVKLKIADQGKSVLLTRSPDGTWSVPGYYGFPADFQKLSGFVNDLTSAKIEQLVTTNPQRLARLEFKDTQIDFLDAADKPLLTLTFGKAADAGGKFVRLNNEPRGYRTNSNAWIDAEAKNWADASLVTIKPEDVTKVEVEFPHASPVVAIRAKKEDLFTTSSAPKGDQLNASKLTALLSTLTGLRFSDTTTTEDANAIAAKENQRSVKLTTFDGKTLRVALGRKPEQKIVKPLAAKADGKTGPAALGSIETVKNGSKPEGPKALTPEVETVPAGPVFASVSSSDEKAPINVMMKARAFQVYDYGFSTLPQSPADLFEPAPVPPPAKPAEKPAK